MHKYITKETCSKSISYQIEGNKLKNVTFKGGCPGNLQGLSALVEGMDIDEVIKRLKGIKCGFMRTSCPDQLARALEEYKLNSPS